VQPRRVRALSICLGLSLVLGLGGCGTSPLSANKPAKPQHQAKTPFPVTPAPPPGTPGPAPESGSPAPAEPHLRACVAALRQAGVANLPAVPAVRADFAWPTTVLAASLAGGPLAAPGHASPIETATWNLVSNAIGLPLTPYLGQKVAEVYFGNPGGTTLDCLEQGTRVVGAYETVWQDGAQPLTYASALGESVRQLTGRTYLAWLEASGAYRPAPRPNTASLTAAEALEDFFATINSHPPAAAEHRLERAFLAPSLWGGMTPFFSGFHFWVPVSIGPATCPFGSRATPDEATFGAMLWPYFYGTPLLAGDGFTGELITLERPDSASPWRIAGMATGC